MTTFDLNKELKYVNHSREHRRYYAQIVIDNPGIIKEILDLAFDVNNKESCKAALLLEFVVRLDITAILPHLDKICTNISRLRFDGAIRPMAKICEDLISAFYSSENNEVKSTLSQKNRERIVEQSFEYLLGNYAPAPKAYGMSNLYLLGYEFEWIHPELVLILERDFSRGSAGYKVRARRILKSLKNDQ